MPLQHDLRPKNFDEFFGNKGSIESLRSALERDASERPHSFLVTGPSGCGKTTIARIIAESVGCSKMDYHEMDASDDRGIDSMRELKRIMQYAPTMGDVKVFLLDECFHEDTQIKTVNGLIKIKDIRIGDTIINIKGNKKVKNVFKNRVGLERVTKITLDTGVTIFCSKEHLFLTSISGGEERWVPAKDLDAMSILCHTGDSMQKTITREVANENLRCVWGNIQTEKENKSFLFKSLLGYMEKQKCRICAHLHSLWEHIQMQGSKCKVLLQMQAAIRYGMRRMWKAIQWGSGRKSQVLLPILCGKMALQTSACTTYVSDRGLAVIPQKGYKRIAGGTPEEMGVCCGKDLKKDENNQSRVHGRCSEKDKENKGKKRDTACLAWKTWWKWKLNRATNYSCIKIGVAHGVCSESRTENSRVPDKLQTGHCESNTEVRDRDRWQGAHLVSEKQTGCKEGKETERIGVACVESYQRGRNDKSFLGVIGDQERDQDFVNFYDLEIEDHPSYIANGCVVHNCHGITGPAQESLLKLLEEPPSHVYIILATTEPEKLKITIKRRCHPVTVAKFSDAEMRKFLISVLATFGTTIEEYSKAIVDKLIETAEGSPGVAVALLDSVLDISDEETALNAITENASDETNIAMLCRELLSNTPNWKKIVQTVNGLKAEPEQSRYQIMGYMTKVLENSGSGKAAHILGMFLETFIYSKKAGLILACYHAMQE